MAINRWTREQLLLAFHLYCQLPFGRLHARNPDIIALARLIDRTPSAVAMKLVNFASLDPAITSTGRKGLSGASQLDHEVWLECQSNWSGMVDECLALKQSMQLAQGGEPASQGSESILPLVVAETNGADYTGKTRQVLTAQRVRQQFFRDAVLVSYDHRCCITGIAEPKLLLASHIVPWSADEANRLNPANGLCLSALHDRAFDQGLLTIDAEYQVLLSDHLLTHPDPQTQQAFVAIDGQPIRMPDRFLPDPAFLQWHRDNLFVGRQAS